MNSKRHPPDEDAALVASWRGGELASFEALVHRHQKRMLNIAFRITGDYEVSCDVVQDAFAAAYRTIDSFGGTPPFSIWLTSITVDRSRTRLEHPATRRKDGAQPHATPPARKSDEAVHEWLVAAPSAMEQLERAAIADRLQRCIRTLSIEFRETIILHDVAGFSLDEICAILRTRKGTLQSRLFRAREQVKDCLKKTVGEV